LFSFNRNWCSTSSRICSDEGILEFLLFLMVFFSRKIAKIDSSKINNPLNRTLISLDTSLLSDNRYNSDLSRSNSLRIEEVLTLEIVVRAKELER
jgi:hypothetical protein